MRREEHIVGETFAYRYPASDPDLAVVIQHGIASHGGIYDSFGARLAGHGVDVWSMDAPGHGRSCTTRRPGQFTMHDWVESAVDFGEHVRSETGLPVFVKGSSMGAAAAYSAMAASPDTFVGAILMGYGIPSSPLIPTDNPFRSEAYAQIEAVWGDRFRLDIDRFFDFDTDYGYVGAKEQKHADPLNTWFYDMASWATLFTYDPLIPLAENSKPILYTVGEHDPTFPPSVAKLVVDTTGGDPDFHVHPDGKHQLMLFHTEEYSALVAEWCRQTLTDQEQR